MVAEDRVALVGVPDVLEGWGFPRPARSTLDRWVRSGARGRVLETVRVGGRVYTSLEALGRFLEGPTASPPPGGPASSGGPPRGRQAPLREGGWEDRLERASRSRDYSKPA